MQQDNEQIKAIIKTAIFNHYKKMNETFPIKPGNIFIDQHIFNRSREASENRADYKEVVSELIKQGFFVRQDRTDLQVAGYKITDFGVSEVL